MKRIISIIIISFAVLVAAKAESFEQIKAAAQTGYSELPQGAFIEGIIVSEYKSLNMGENQQVAWNKVDTRYSYCTAYIQNEEGTSGFRLIFNDLYDNRFPRFSKVRINLSGCLINHETEPERYTISGLTAESVQLISGNTPIVKTKNISQLTDSDVYTYVTLQNLEFATKEGSYTNVNEFVVQKSELNAFMKPADLECIDVAGIYAKDHEGEAIFLPVNTSCYWRRRGERLPHGVGSISGIVVPGNYPRFGEVGRYALRIASPADVAIPMETASNYEIITEWNWDRNYDYALKLERQGHVKWIEAKKLPADRILADIGHGFLSTTADATLDVTHEFNTKNPQDGYRPGIGCRHAAAIRLDAPTVNWFRKGACIMIETSTKGFTGQSLSLDFTWCAGDRKPEECFDFPAHWRVAYSIDGRNFMPVAKTFILRSQSYEKTPLSYYAAPGFVENILSLPGFLLGQEKIFIMIYPVDNVVAQKHSDVTMDVNTGSITPDFNGQTVLCIGKVSLKCLK